jgi:sec-independent protein translocase protein TatA
MSLGTPELVVIFVLILLLFGPNRLPELARGLGKGMREFRKVTSEFQNQLSALGEHEDEPRRAQNDRSNHNDDYRTASYDSNKLDNTYNHHDTDDAVDLPSTEATNRYSPPTDDSDSEEQTTANVLNGTLQSEAAHNDSSAPDDTPSTNDPKPAV